MPKPPVLEKPVRRSGVLDVVRGTAILAVIGVHAFQAAVAIAPEGSIAIDSRMFVAFSYLRFGVELFFALSGWLMFALYYRNEKISTQSYWARRILRLWPLWILFTVLSFVVSLTAFHYLVSFDGNAYSVLELVVAFLICIFFLGWLSETFWNVPFGGWSIQVEVGHYLLFWPMRSKSARFIMATVFVGYATYFVASSLEEQTGAGFLHDAAGAWIRFGLYGTWPFFLAGGLAYLVTRRVRDMSRAQFFALSLQNWPLILMGGAILLISLKIPIPQGQSKEAIVAVIILLGLSWCAVKLELLSRLFQSWGRYSYFMYFAHFWVLNAVVHLATSNGWQLSIGSSGVVVATYFAGLAILAIGVSWALAIPSWRLFESKFLKFARNVR